ncbi:MAG: (d)CMP kinase [Erysipelotrichaceae bacterium]|nr:(d)CMP kinase [Erysipelotrichaceae bacterium]
MRRINIAIDGPSAAGKSTIAKRVAKELGYVHLDTGAMYRCIGLKCRLTAIDLDDEAMMKEMLSQTEIELTADGKVFLDGKDVSMDIRTEESSMWASNVSTRSVVRSDLVSRQQKMALAKGFVMDGRDIGTVVLKDAELKIFQTASVEARAKRRFLENQAKGMEADYEAIYRDIERRDYQDTHREHSPLSKAEDAILIDTSDLSIDEVTAKILKLAYEAMEQ